MLISAKKGATSAAGPYSGVNPRGKKLSHGNAFVVFGIAKTPKPKGEHNDSDHP